MVVTGVYVLQQNLLEVAEIRPHPLSVQPGELPVRPYGPRVAVHPVTKKGDTRRMWDAASRHSTDNVNTPVIALSRPYSPAAAGGATAEIPG